MACDCKDAWENPPGANWKHEIAQVRQVMPALENALSTKLRLDDGVQDASFFADLGVLTEQPTETGVVHLCYRLCFRFSWFGRMVSIFGDNTDEYDVGRAIQLLKEHGYIYVPAAELDAPYNGVNEPYEPGLTWWVRYFDYL